MIKKNQDHRSFEFELSGRRRQALVAVFVVLAVSIFCDILYQWNNQYTSGCKQPREGVLSLNQQELEDTPVYHLVDGWVFYPNQILAPGDVAQHPENYEHTFTSVEKNRDYPSRGTYCLHLQLPRQTRSYAMILPVIPTAYRFYVNGNLIVKVDDSDFYRNREVLREREICFQAGGDTELLLVYENQVKSASGMTYPPMFGSPIGIRSVVARQQIFSGAAVMLAFLTMLMSLCMFYQVHQRHNLYIIGLCVVAVAYLLCPVLKTLEAMPQILLHNLRIAAYFGCHAMVIWAYASYFEWKDPLVRLMKAVALFCLISSILIGVLTRDIFGTQTLYIMYKNAQFLAWLAVVNGILLTVWIVFKNISQRGLLTAGTVVLWMFPLENQVTKNCYTAVSGRFSEIGIVVLMGLLIIAEYIHTAEACHVRMIYEDRLSQGVHLRKLSEAHYTQLQDQITKVGMIQHDLRQHLRILRTLLDQGNTEELSAYLERYTQMQQSVLEKPIQFCQIPVVDALLFYYWSAARQLDAKYTVSVQINGLPEEMHVDVCTVMGNLLENALDSVRRQTEGEKFIQVDCHIMQQKLVMQIINTNTTAVVQEQTRFYSAKHREFGVGTLSVQTIAQQYGGYADFSYSEGLFTSRLVMSIRDEKNTDGARPVDRVKET